MHHIWCRMNLVEIGMAFKAARRESGRSRHHYTARSTSVAMGQFTEIPAHERRRSFRMKFRASAMPQLFACGAQMMHLGL
jgi:hypothetical protein